MPSHERGTPATVSAIPQVRVGGDPAVCRMLVVTLVGTACCLATAAGLLSVSGFHGAWWAWVMVAILALPALRPGPVTIALAVADYVVLWAILGAHVGGATSLVVLGLHTGVTVWLLATTVPPGGRWHRSALRAVVLRWVWIQVIAQVASVLAAVTTHLTDPLVGTAGLVAALVVVLAVAYWGLRQPERDRR